MSGDRLSCRASAVCWLGIAVGLAALPAQELGDKWGTEHAEAEFYRLVDIPLPRELGVEAGSFTMLPDGRLAIGTRRGDIYFLDGAFDPIPEPRLQRFASGLDEVLGLGERAGALFATQQTEVTRITDTDGDGRADRFDTLSDAWGFANYHEFAWGSKPDRNGDTWVALGLSNSYHYRADFRGWAFRVTEDGRAIPVASGIRSAGGVAPNEHGVMFYTESQGPWNGSCSLKHLKPGGFMGHPVSFPAYDAVPGMTAPKKPNGPSRLRTEADRIPELVPYAVVFPYRKMGQSISGFRVDRTGGKFGPFEDQIFVGDYSLSLIMRATTEQVNGVWQGACYPFREGLGTGILAVEFSPTGHLVAGGTNRGWPVRGHREFVIERLEWTGKTPFEIERISILPSGFRVRFTMPVDRDVAGRPDNFRLETFTHIYRQGYGSPEVDQTTPTVTGVVVAEDGLSVDLAVEGVVRGHVHAFDLGALRSAGGRQLLHRHAYYTVNEIPEAEPGAEPSRWLRYAGKDGPGRGKHVVLIAAEQEYRSEQAMPMLAKILAEHHGFDCTVLFAQKDGLVDPTQKIRWQDESVTHSIPGLELLRDADAMILFSRLLTLPDQQVAHIIDYVDSGKPILAIRTANHGFLENFPYEIGGKRVRFGDDVLGGAFRAHHGGWHRESTRGLIVEAARAHPVLRGVEDVWGPSDVYRTFPKGGALPADCDPLLLGQPLIGRRPTDLPNTKKQALPVAWTKYWTTSSGQKARVFHTTMGSARDFQSAGLRRLVVNATYWGLGLEGAIDPGRSVDYVGAYDPLPSGFNYEKLGVRPRPVRDYR